jgi:rubrerythrin
LTENLIKVLYECLTSKQYSTVLYDKLAQIARDEQTRLLLRRYAEDEKSHCEILRSLYERTSDKVFNPPAIFDVKINDIYTGLLDCIARKITDIDNYKALLSKLQAADVRTVLNQLLQCEVRHAFGLLVLITPDDIALRI